jgi:uncharacterized membrane protein YfcA
MLFETAGIEIEPWVPPLVAFGISFFTSMGGLSGAFLLLPFQMTFLGYTTPSVSATNQLFNVVAIPSGVYRYWKERRMVWPLTWAVLIGVLPGILVGAFIRIAHLPDPGRFKLFAAAVLLYIGLRLAGDLLRKPRGESDIARGEGLLQKPARWNASGAAPATVTITHRGRLRFGYTFRDREYRISTPGVALLGFAVGVVGGIYGIGGGAIIAPFLITFFRLPVYTIAGTTLMATFVASVAGVGFYQALAPYYPGVSVAPDWMLGLLFGVGGGAGMYLGARCQKFVPARVIKWVLAAVTVVTAVKYVIDALG